MDLEQKVDRILFYLESDPKTKHIGLVEQVDNNTQDIVDFKTERKVLWGKVGVVSFILGSIGGLIMFAIKLFYK